MKRWVWAMFAVELCAHGARTHAQSDEALSGVLQIQSQAAPCLTETALRERVRHWLAPRAAATGVTVVVDAGADPPAFRVLRGGAVIALRRFALLPSACADRLDAIALPVALAIEQANEASSAPASTATSTAASAANATAASGSATPKTPENLAQTDTKPAASPAPDAAHADKPNDNAAAAPTASEAAQSSAAANPGVEQPHEDTAEPPQPHTAEVESRAEVSRSDADSSRWSLFAGGSLLFEALPHTVVAVEAGPELRLSEHLSVSLGALVTAQTEHALGSVHSQAQVFGGRALLCANWPLGAFGFDACAGAIGGAVAVNTSGTDMRQTLAWVAGLARAALFFPVRSVVSVRLGLSGLLNAVRPRLLANGTEPRAVVAGVVGAETSLELLIALP